MSSVNNDLVVKCIAGKFGSDENKLFKIDKSRIMFDKFVRILIRNDTTKF